MSVKIHVQACMDVDFKRSGGGILRIAKNHDKDLGFSNQ